MPAKAGIQSAVTSCDMSRRRVGGATTPLDTRFRGYDVAIGGAQPAACRPMPPRPASQVSRSRLTRFMTKSHDRDSLRS